MEELNTYLSQSFTRVKIDFGNKNWHTEAKIPSKHGWYYVSTTAPVEVLQRQQLWGRTHCQKRSGVEAKVLNIDIATRAARYQPDMQAYWNTSAVYSGLAAKLLNRAREHTFPDPGTQGLALFQYPELSEYEWHFCYVTLARFQQRFSCPDMMLQLGEQMWRAKNGWPLLCGA
jgi:hypothetical protein